MYEVGIGFIFRSTDTDQYGTRQLGRILPHDDGQRWFADRIRHPSAVRATITSIDFANTMLHVKAKVTQANGNDLPADAAVGSVNLFLHSLFSQVDISLNGALITSSTNTYPYRAMLKTLLSYGQDAKASQSTSALYYKDASVTWTA